MSGRTFLRVLSAALALSAISFAADIVGDLSDRPADSGARVVVRIPPPMAAAIDAPRAEAAPAMGFFPRLVATEG